MCHLWVIPNLPPQSASSQKRDRGTSLRGFVGHAHKWHVSIQLFSAKENFVTSLQGPLGAKSRCVPGEKGRADVGS